MKHLVCSLTAFIMTCTGLQAANIQVSGNAISVEETNVKELIDSARWGDRQAYLHLADCYRNGTGVKKDFLCFYAMVKQALSFKVITSIKEYAQTLPKNDTFRTMLEISDATNDILREKKDSLDRILTEMDTPDSYAFRAVIAITINDEDTALKLLRTASEKGSNVASLILAASGLKEPTISVIPKFEMLCKETPVTYRMLANIYIKKGDKKQAAIYLMKSEEHAMISKKNAKWLLEYDKSGGEIKLTENDRQRLKAFVGATGEEFGEE